MKKAIFATLASLAFASTAFAATPAMDLGAGQTQIGYSHSNLQTSISAGDLGNYHANDYQLAYGINDKLAITGNYLDSGSKSFWYNGSTVNNLKFNSSEIGLQYKLSNNIAVSAGSLQSELTADAIGSNSSNEVFGGIAYKQNLSNNLGSYASYVKSSNVEDWKAGLTYNLSSKTSLDVGYRHYQNDNAGLTAKGVSFGLNHKF